MKPQLPQIMACALFVSVGVVCVDAEEGDNTRRGDYEFGTREQTQTEQTTRVRETYSPTFKITPQKDDRANAEKYGTPWGSDGQAATTEAYATDEAPTQAPQTISGSSVSGRILEWTDDGTCEFRTDSGDKYHVRLWLVDMPKEGEPNCEKLMKFARSHDIYGEGRYVKLRIIAENPDKPEYKIGILIGPGSSSCQEAFWKSGYCGLDDDEHELERNEKDAEILIGIFRRLQRGKQGLEKYGAPRGADSTSERATSAKNSQKGSDRDLVVAQVTSAPLLVEEAKKLIKDDTDEDAKNWLLIRAVKYGTPDAVEFLLENGASPNVRDSAGSTALMEAAKRGDLKVSELLVKHGADVNAVDLYKNTALFRAMEYNINRLDLAKFLVEHGADVNVQRRDGYTALMMAIDKNNWDAVKYLIDRGADPNLRLDKTYERYTPLMRVAARRDALDIVKLLVEHGADMSMKNRAGETALDIAKKSNNTAVLDYFAEQEIVAMNNRSAADYKKLCDIIANDKTNDLSQLKDALEAGIDPDAMRDAKTKHTVLHHVIWEDKRPAVVKMLLEYGANPNATKTDGGTCLRICLAKGHDDAEIANLLCDYGADINTKGKDGRTPLDIAVARDKPKTGRVLVAYGAMCTKKHAHMDLDVWKAILKRPQTRTAKHANTPKKSGDGATVAETDDGDASDHFGVGAHVSSQQSSLFGFGIPRKRGEALRGTLFDLKQSAKGAELATTAGNNAVKQKEQLHTAINTLDNGWKIENLKKRYRAAPTTLYTKSIFICDEKGGPLDAKTATEAFKDEDGKKPFEAPGWLCYYEGYFSVPQTGEYRFVGMGDDVLLVGVDKKTVLYAFWPGEGHGPAVKFVKGWEPDNFCGKGGTDGKGMARGGSGHRNMLYKGLWLHLAAGKYYFIQVAFGEAAGGKAGAWLGVQMKDRDTDDNFPLFTLERVTPDLQLDISETGKYNTSSVFSTPQVR